MDDFFFVHKETLFRAADLTLVISLFFCSFTFLILHLILPLGVNHFCLFSVMGCLCCKLI